MPKATQYVRGRVPRAVVEQQVITMLRKHARDEPIPSTAIADQLGLSAFELNGTLWPVLDRLAQAGKIRRVDGPHKKCQFWLWQGGRAKVTKKPSGSPGQKLRAAAAEVKRLREELADLDEGIVKPERRLHKETIERAERAEAAIERVRALHPQHTDRHGSWCGTCHTAWPCPTFAATDQTRGDE